jgi:hypothetical protein
MRSVIDQHKTIPRNKIITPLFHLKKQKQTKNKQNKQTNKKNPKLINQLYTVTIF